MHTKLEDQTRLLKRKMLAWFCMLSLFINQQKSKKNIWVFFMIIYFCMESCLKYYI